MSWAGTLRSSGKSSPCPAGESGGTTSTPATLGNACGRVNHPCGVSPLRCAEVLGIDRVEELAELLDLGVLGLRVGFGILGRHLDPGLGEHGVGPEHGA